MLQDCLYHNNGDGTLTNIATQALPHTPWSSMGCDVADINNDGRMDFMATDMSAIGHYRQKLTMGNMAARTWLINWGEPRQYMRNAVYLNTGAGRFMEMGQMMGLDRTNWTWTAKLNDLDCDGLVDLYVTNGMIRDWQNADLHAKGALLGDSSPAFRKFWLSQEPNRRKNLAYRNSGDLDFEPVGESWRLDHEGVSFGAAMGDLDGDGDLDLVVNNFEEPASVYRNDVSSGHRVLIRLMGSTSNHWGIGASVRLQSALGQQVRYLTLSRGFMSTDDPLVHFGLGADEIIETLSVHWPSGHVQRYENLEVDRLYTLTEPSGTAPSRDARGSEVLYARSQVMDSNKYQHRESRYNDFADQPLLPNKLSQLGPALAWGDLDGDGDEDLFAGGAAGQTGRPYMRLGDGRLVDRQWTAKVFQSDRLCEDMGVLLFDADSDGDQDIYVVSGGVEHGGQDQLLADRLYLNDSSGQFEKSIASALPAESISGSVVAACDYDRDGDLDLFVGGRVIPGQYPLTPRSRLLRNDWSTSRRFTDVTGQVCPELGRSGLVTSALWSDADGDGFLDLLVTHEWGPVKLYHNEQGAGLTDQTVHAGLSNRLGWWNGIAGSDLDHDGDVDYVVTNFGLNTKYHVSMDQPTLLYYGDFDGTGKKQLVEAEYEDKLLYPIRGKSCSTNAMPFLKDKFTTFHAFASADLTSIYTTQCLRKADRYQVNTLESGVLVNDGHGRFMFQLLPRLAQVSPGFGVVLTEVDGDGHVDLYMVQNFHSPQLETGRMDGGVSLLLRGMGDGSFDPVWPDRSGLVVSGDAKSLVTTDFNGDGWVDFLVGINDGVPEAFEHRGGSRKRVFTVRLEGKAGNPTGVGAQVTVRLDSGPTQTSEVYAGGGYLSQSTSALTFGLGEKATVERIEVRWPDGQMSSHEVSKDQRMVVIKLPTSYD